MTEQTCEGRVSTAALVILITGVIITAASFMWPIDFDYKIDPTLSAAENERRQMQNDRSNFLIGVISLIGMSLVTFGGLVTSALFCKNVVMDELLNPTHFSTRDSRSGLSSLSGRESRLLNTGVQRYDAGTQLRECEQPGGWATSDSLFSLALPGSDRDGDSSSAKTYGTLDNSK